MRKFIIIDLADGIPYKYLSEMSPDGGHFTRYSKDALMFDTVKAAEDVINIFQKNATKVWLFEIKPVYLLNKN